MEEGIGKEADGYKKSGKRRNGTVHSGSLVECGDRDRTVIGDFVGLKADVVCFFNREDLGACGWLSSLSVCLQFRS